MPGRRPHRADLSASGHGGAGSLRHYRRLRVLPGQHQLRHQPQKLARAFRRVHTFLMPGGLFLFDINTPQKLRGLDGQMFLDESEDAYCVWRADWSERRRICTYGMDIFRLEPGGLWSRWEEVHEEYAYEPAELEELLRQAGFRQIRQYGELRFRAPREGEQRIFFAARKEF